MTGSRRAIAAAIAGLTLVVVVFALVAIVVRGRDSAASDEVASVIEPTPAVSVVPTPPVTRTPRPSPTPAPPRPEPGVPFALTLQPIDVDRVAVDDPRVAPGMPFVYDVSRHELRRLALDMRDLVLSPFSDMLIATRNDGLVVIDLAQPTAALIPVHGRVHRWLDERRVLLVISEPTTPGTLAQPPSPAWRGGLYDLDVVTATVIYRGAQGGQYLSSTGAAAIGITQETNRALVATTTDTTINLEAPTTVGASVPWKTIHRLPLPNEVGKTLGTPSWAPDDSSVVFISNDQSQLFKVDRKTGQSKLMDTGSTPTQIGARIRIAAPLWSSDARRMVSSLCCTDELGFEARIIDVTGVTPAFGPFVGFVPAAWQPGGTLLLGFADYCKTNGRRPAVIDAKTGEPRVLDGLPSTSELAWSPDGSLFAMNQFGAAYIVDPLTGSALRLPPFGSQAARGLHWSATGRWLVINSPTGGSDNNPCAGFDPSTGRPSPRP